MKIQSSNVLDTLVNKIYNLIFGWIDSLFDDSKYEKTESKIPKSKAEKPKEKIVVDDETVDPEDVEIADDGKEVTFTPEDETYDEFTVQILPIDIKGDVSKVMIVVKNNSTGKESKPKIVDESDTAEIQKIIKEAKEYVSSTILVELNKITATSEVRLTNISSNYALPETVRDLSCILPNPEFQSSVPEGTCVCRIESQDNGYQIDLVDDIKFSTSMYSKCLDQAVKSFAKVSELSWYANGLDYSNFRTICESLTYNLQYQITELAKLCIIHDASTTFYAQNSIESPTDEKWQILKECILEYIAELELLAMNRGNGEEEMLNSWIRQLNDIILYQFSCLHP